MDLADLNQLSDQLNLEASVNELINPEKQQLEPLKVSNTSEDLKAENIVHSDFYLVDQKMLLDGYFRYIKQTLNIELPQDLQYLIALYIARLLFYAIGKAIITSTDTYKPISEINDAIPVIKSIFINCKNMIIIDGDDNTFVYGSNEHCNLHLNDTNHLVSIYLTPLNQYLADKVQGIPRLFSYGICNEYWNFFCCNDNTLYASGNNEEGCCGNGECMSSSVLLEKINTNFLQSNDYIMDMVCGAAHTLFITKYGNLYAVGWNGFGCCGKDNIINNILKPTLIMGNVIKAACGETHNLVITYENELIVFGGNAATQLGIGKVTNENKHIDIPLIHPWFKDKNIKIANVCCGFHHSLCIDTNGNVYIFGVNNYGCIKGENYSKIYHITAEHEEFDEKTMVFEPYSIGLENKVISASCGECHNMILDANNDIFVWGRNDKYQISSMSSGVITNILKISKVQDLGMHEKTFIEQIICTHSSSIVVINASKYC